MSGNATGSSWSAVGIFMAAVKLALKGNQINATNVSVRFITMLQHDVKAAKLTLSCIDNKTDDILDAVPKSLYTLRITDNVKLAGTNG